MEKDTKKLYKFITNITGIHTCKGNPIPESESANIFAKFFMDKISKIHDALNDEPLYLPDKR